MTIAQFLIFWTHFVATHYCDVWWPDPVGLGNHVIYEGNCTDGFGFARVMHTAVTWTGIPPELSQGTWVFP